MSQEQIDDLQRRLDEKLIDPKNLTLGQKGALNDAFQKGLLKGYGSVGDMISERRIARSEIATDVKAALEPLKPTSVFSLGLRRAVLATTGDLVGSFVPYILDGKKNAQAARELAFAGKGLTYLPEIRQNAGEKAFSGFAKALTTLPGLKQLGLFKKTASVLDSVVNSSKALAAGNLILPQIAKTELKSQALGAAGAAAGSVTFDMINLPARLIAAGGEDLSKYDSNEYNKLPFVSRVAINAYRESLQSLLWNAGTFTAVQTARGTFGALGRLFDLNPANVAKINQKINNQGYGQSSLDLASGLGGMSGLFKGLNKIGSVFLAPAGEVSLRQQKQVAQAFIGIEGNLKEALLNAPLVKQEILAHALQTTIRKTYAESGNLYGSLYKNHENAMTAPSFTMTKYVDLMRDELVKNGTFKNTLGDIESLNSRFVGGFDMPFIASTQIRKATDGILGAVEKNVSKETLARTRFAGLYDEGNDITIRTAEEIRNRLNGFKTENKGDFLTPRQFTNLLRLWNGNYAQTAIKGSKAEPIWQMREAFEDDFNYLSRATNEEILKTNGKVKNAYDQFSTVLGPKKANEFLNEFKQGVTAANVKLQEANFAFGESVNFYNSEKMAKIARQMDPAIFAAKGGVEFFRAGNITNVQGMNNLFNAAINPKSGNTDSVSELFTMIGGGAKLPGEAIDVYNNRLERAQYTLRLITARKFFDAFNRNAVVRNTNVTGSGKQLDRPFEEIGIDGVDEAIQLLKERENPAFQNSVESILKNQFGLGYEKLNLSPENMIKFERRAMTTDVIKSALKDEIPINSTVFIKREVDQGFTERGKFGRLGGFKTTEGKTLEPFTADTVKLTERAREGQILEGGKLRDVTKIEREAAQFELENLTFRMRGFQNYDYKNLGSELGLDNPTGRAQLKKIFELGRGMKSGEASKHVDNIETILEGLKKTFDQTPAGDPVAFAYRSALLGGGIGFLAGGGLGGAAGGGLGGAIMAGLMLKGAAAIVNTPKIASMWLEVAGRPNYTVGQRMDINSIRALQPNKRAVFADMFNFIFSMDDDAPKVNPNDIDEERIIKYLQGNTKVSIPTDKGVYNSLSESIKDKFSPERIKLKQIKGETKKDFNTFMQGSQIASFRENLIDNLDTEQGMKVASQPRVAQFIQNPMDLKVPEGAKTMQANINPVTADVYAGLFPGDTIGATIAQSQQPRPPMMKKGGFVNVKNY